LDDHIKEDEMGGACRKQRQQSVIHGKFLVREPDGNRPLEIPYVGRG
jgi:hypothetical protein